MISVVAASRKTLQFVGAKQKYLNHVASWQSELEEKRAALGRERPEKRQAIRTSILNRIQFCQQEAVRYFFPADDSDSAKAKLAFFKRPAAFQVLVGRFDVKKAERALTLNIYARTLQKAFVALCRDSSSNLHTFTV